MPNYIHTVKSQNSRNEIEKERKKFSEISDAFPNSDVIKESAVKLCKNYEDLLLSANLEIDALTLDLDESESKIQGLNKENSNLSSDLYEYESGDKSSPKSQFYIKTLEDEMKVELLQAAMKKFSLVQLEQKLGNKFQLI